MTSYLASYDVESIRCLEGVRSIAGQHRRYGVPATFFIVGELLEDAQWAQEFQSIVEGPLFEVQNHTYSHLRLQFGLSVDTAFLQLFAEELSRTNALISDRLGRTVTGFRSPMGFPDGLRGEERLLKVLWDHGIRFVCTQAVGKHHTVPAPFASPYYYDEEDILHPILEIPAHGWHDNVLKGYNYCPVLWPPLTDWGYPASAPVTPEEEFSVYKLWIDHAVAEDLLHIAPIFHPWSVHRFNAEAETIGLILDYLVQQQIPICTYSQLYHQFLQAVPV
ncbi:MAG: polysaccharide deacetylase family protein [Spirochaetia bacterium]|nr:polysaccharide deacetylase family protein [Spirochaetia bacterium]